MSALTHSPGFFDFLGTAARALAPIASIAAPFFPPAAAVAGIAGTVGTLLTPGVEDSFSTLVRGVASSVGSTFPSVAAFSGFAGEGGPEADVIEQTDGEDMVDEGLTSEEIPLEE